MKNFRLLFILALIFICSLCFAESITFVPTAKIRAGVINTDGNLGTILPGENVFENLENNKFFMAGFSSYDMNFSFYNPRGDQDSVDYWKIDMNTISLKLLNQYDIVLLPFDEKVNNLSYRANKVLAEWVQKGGILWIDNKGYSGSLNVIPFGLYSFDTSNNNNLNVNSPLRDYPFSLRNFGAGIGNTALNLNGAKGMEIYPNSLNFSGNKSNVLNGVIPLGNGKVIYTSGSATEKDNEIYMCVNLLFSALSPNSNGSYAKYPALFGENLSSDITYTGSKPIVHNGHVYYLNSNAVFVDGVNLFENGAGQKPENDISAPAIMGDSDIAVYDTEGNLFICNGLSFDEKGKPVTDDCLWMNIFDKENDADDNTCAKSVKYSPLVLNYWVYYVNDKGNLNCVYTKELDNGKAKYAKTIKGGILNAEVYAGPALNSYTDMYGSYITEVAWTVLNDNTADLDKQVFNICTVPVLVLDEVSVKQPKDNDPQNQIVPNYFAFPKISGSTSFRFFADKGDKPEYAFVTGYVYAGGKSHKLSVYTKNNETDWDIKVNYSSKGGKRNGYILLNTKTDDGVTKFASDSSVGKSALKDFATNLMTFKISYVPCYNMAVKSKLDFSLGMVNEQILKACDNGFIYKVDQENDTDSNAKMTYVNKFAVKEDLRENSNQRYNAWSYLVHTGFTGLMSPLDENTAMNVASYIDWGFPGYAPSHETATIKINGVSAVNDKVYISATANIADNYSRSAVICLDGNAEPKVKIVDENGNPVVLKYMQNRPRIGKRETNYSVKVYQPSVYDTEIAYASRVFNAPSVDYNNGIVKADNMKNFQNGGKSQLITSSLPLFVKLTYDEDLTNSSPQSKYIPVVPGTCSVFDETAYNSNVGKPEFPLSDGDNNISKKLYADMTEWNQVDWYAVLPGNIVTCGEPIVSGDKVTVFGFERDEYGVDSQNKSYTINTKMTDGAKIRDNQISSANLSNTVHFDSFDTTNISYGLNKVAFASGNEITVLENKKNLVVDNASLMEIDPAGKTVWRLSKVEYDNGKLGDESENYDFTLENPVRARYAGDNNHIAVADAGIKTIFVMDKNGWLKPEKENENTGNWWKFSSFDDPYNILRSGESFELGSMCDFCYWTEVKGDITYHHFLTADTTYKRVLDLVIETDENGNVTDKNAKKDYSVIPYLNWATYDTIQGNKNNFVSVDITENINDRNGNKMRAVVCGVSNYNASDRNGIRRSKGGSVRIYDYRIGNADNSLKNAETYALRFGKLYDTIGKKGDVVFDISSDIESSSVQPSINGLKKAVIANLDGRDYQEEALSDYDDLRILICDEFGVNEYYIDNKEVYNGVTYYFWRFNYNRCVHGDFAFEIPSDAERDSEYRNYNNTGVFNIKSNLLSAMFKPFSVKYYARCGGDLMNRTNVAPLKAPILPMDVKVLPNGNWLILNGYSGKVNYTFTNVTDNKDYYVEGTYNGEVIEVSFNDSTNEPEIVWSSNNLESFAVDDYMTFGNWTVYEQNEWNNILDDMDGRVYSYDASPFGYNNNIIGGYRYSNKPLKSPKSLDR